MKRRRIIGIVGVLLLLAAGAGYVRSRPTVYHFKHVNVVGQTRQPVVREPIDLACPAEDIFFVLEKDGRLLRFQKAEPYEGQEVARVDGPKAMAYDETTGTVLVLAGAGHAVFRVNHLERQSSLLFELKDHYPLGAKTTGFSVDPHGHILINNSTDPRLAPILALDPTDGTVRHEFAARTNHDDPDLAVAINAARLRFAPNLIALWTNLGTVTTFFRGRASFNLRLPRYEYWEPPKKDGDGAVVSQPVHTDAAPIFHDDILILGPAGPRSFGFVLTQQLRIEGVVRLSEETPDWVAQQPYESICRLSYDTYALTTRDRVDIYQLY